MATKFRTREETGASRTGAKRLSERMQNRTRRDVRRTNYRKITRQSILSSVARTKKAGRGTGRKFTSKDLVGVPPAPCWCGRRPAASNGVTLKKRRATEIIPDNHHYIQRPAQSSTQYRQRDATVAATRDGRSLWKKKKDESCTGCVKIFVPSSERRAKYLRYGELTD